MFKFVTRSQSLMGLLQKKPLLKHLWIYDYSALNDIQDNDFYNLVYSHIIVSNGLTKTTRSERFKDLDTLTIDLLRGIPGARIHDTGVSNGITSLELYQQLIANNIDFQLFISDKYAKIYYKGNRIKKFYDADGNLISVNLFFLHLSPGIGKAFFFSRLFFSFFKRREMLSKTSYREIVLLAPEVYRLIQEKKIQLLDFDVFSTQLNQPFLFIRCMNVLMPAYFSVTQIQTGTANLGNNIAEGGYLLLGRTDAAGTNHATFYRKINQVLRPQQSVNDGFDYNNPT